MKISPEEIKRVRKTLLLNLVAADAAIVTGLMIWFFGGHKVEMTGFFIVILGAIWALMSVSKIFKFRRFLAENRKE